MGELVIDGPDFRERQRKRAELERRARLLAGVPLIRAMDHADLLDTEIPPLEPLLAPWLREKTLAMVHAWRGVGKTYFSMSVALAVAEGGDFLGWQAPRARKVLYLDGELPARIVQERLRLLRTALDAQPLGGMLRVYSPDLSPDAPVPDLATPVGQELVNMVLDDDTALVIVDNISAFVRSAGPENDAESWGAVSDWAQSLRREGRAVLFVHHSGKGGKQRGTSKREDLLDVVIGLRRPPDYAESEGCRFEVTFEKARSLYGEEVEPIEARLEEIPDSGGLVGWTTDRVIDNTRNRVATLWDAGLTVTDIARELGIAKSGVTRHLQRAAAEGCMRRPYEPAGNVRQPGGRGGAGSGVLL